MIIYILRKKVCIFSIHDSLWGVYIIHFTGNKFILLSIMCDVKVIKAKKTVDIYLAIHRLCTICGLF